MDAVTGLTAPLGGATFQSDALAIGFGALFAALWVAGGVHAALTLEGAERRRLFAFYVPAATGGIAVVFAADAVAFYLCFALMALSSWGLITHPRTAEARRAGGVYLGVTVVGEALLLAALMVLASETGSTTLAVMAEGMPAAAHGAVAFGLVTAAFGLKLGAVGAGGILPLSYAHPPAGAAAALAGASTTVGALGLLRLLPLGAEVPASWGVALIVIGLASAFVGAALGVFTSTPRAVLGYSSASQMGFVFIAAGAGLADPGAATYAAGAIVAYAVHHGIAKAALFLGDDAVASLRGAARRRALVALALPALALVGVPLTSGFVAKNALKYAAQAAAGDAAHLAYTLLPWAAMGTALVMLRFMALTAGRAEPGPGGPSRHRPPSACGWRCSARPRPLRGSGRPPGLTRPPRRRSTFRPRGRACGRSCWPSCWPPLPRGSAGSTCAPNAAWFRRAISSACSGTRSRRCSRLASRAPGLSVTARARARRESGCDNSRATSCAGTPPPPRSWRSRSCSWRSRRSPARVY